MGVTKLLRKAQKNKSRAHNRLDRIKDLMRKPEVKNVDIEAIKAEFAAANKQEANAPKAEKAESEPKSEKKESAPKAEESEVPAEEKKAIDTKKDKTESAE